MPEQLGQFEPEVYEGFATKYPDSPRVPDWLATAERLRGLQSPPPGAGTVENPRSSITGVQNASFPLL